ncbi:MAG: DCC1-like thiol-disulfide oxidoreductase family protein [Acidobacteriota bacterium]
MTHDPATTSDDGASAPAPAPSAASATATSHDDGPVLLFDGVCNLCDASVQFILRHEADDRLRFASLQSDAARARLAQAGVDGPLPDSVVLIDDNGVHVQSTAALRAARRLRFPLSLLAVLLLIPRALRDAAYAFIARSRYRWFGRRDTCIVPSPATRARFLDADEPLRVVPPDVDASPDDGASEAAGLGLGTLPPRFLLLYPLIFALPYPLSLLQFAFGFEWLKDTLLARWAGQVVGAYYEIRKPILTWMAERMGLGELTFAPSGSGDRLENYLAALLSVLIASALATGWWLWRRHRPISATAADIAHTLLRYYLAVVMLSYGSHKLFPLQFAMPGPSRLLQTYGESSPMGLMWTFMGASPGYQMFGGFMEVLGGVLLLFRSTALLGALTVIGVMTNVFALNMFYDVPVKLNSFHYLLFAGLLVLPDLPRLLGATLFNVKTMPRDLRAPWRDALPHRSQRGLALLKLAIIGIVIGSNVTSSMAMMKTYGPWVEPHALTAQYRVTDFAHGLSVYIADLPADDDDARWQIVALEPPRRAAIRFADGHTERLGLEVDDAASTLVLRTRGMSDTDQLRWQRHDDGRVTLRGTFRGEALEATLTPVETESLLVTRGFHWISPYPFNR